MKKIVFIIIGIMFSIVSNAQNGGQSSENVAIKLEFFSYSNGTTTFMVTNKQSMPMLIELKSSDNFTNKVIPAFTAETMSLVGLQGSNVRVQAKPENYGNVEIFLNINSLPVRFGVIKIKLISTKQQ